MTMFFMTSLNFDRPSAPPVMTPMPSTTSARIVSAAATF
jgi:hypothetical protein